MKLKEIREKSSPELTKTLKIEREKVRDLRFKDANKQVKNVRDIRSHKKDIARILTILEQRKSEENVKEVKKEEVKKEDEN